MKVSAAVCRLTSTCPLDHVCVFLVSDFFAPVETTALTNVSLVAAPTNKHFDMILTCDLTAVLPSILRENEIY